MTKPSEKTLVTNGITVPNFPYQPYEAIHNLVQKWGQDPTYEHYAGAWNALAYRFKAAYEHGDQFAEALTKHGTAPLPEERYHQEKALYDFFSSAFSAFEASFYGMYSIGVWIAPSSFTLASSKDQQRVNPRYVREAYADTFPGDPFIQAMGSVLNDQLFQSLRDIRNVLTHRSAPGRLHFAGIGVEDITPSVWKLNNLPLDENLVSNSKQTLSRLLQELLEAFETFIRAHA